MSRQTPAAGRWLGPAAILALAVAIGAARLWAPDTVVFTNATSTNQPVAIFDGTMDGTCQQDLVIAGTPNLVFGDVTSSGECPHRLVVFALDRGALRVDRTLNFDPATNQLSLGLPPLRAVSVDVYVVSEPDPLLSAKVEEDIEHARAAFRDHRTGIALQVNVQPMVSLTDPVATSIGTSCRNAWALRSTAGMPYRASRLNVYYVSDIEFTSFEAYTCLVASGPSKFDYAAQNVIYIEHDARKATLAHEIGHALGLYAPEAAWGHIDYAGFSDTGNQGNLMYSVVETVESVWLGQSYRMNFDSRSWLNRMWRWNMPWRMSHVCASDPLFKWPCPPLNIDAPGGGS